MTLKLTYAGFNYVADFDGAYPYANSLPAMVAQTSSNSVALTADYGIDAAHNTVYADYTAGGTVGSTESIADLKAEALVAKSEGLSVILRPLVDYLPQASAATLTGANGNVYANGDWRAYYNPGTVAQGVAFLQSYEATVLLPLAQAAQQVGAEVLDLGTELDQFTGPAYQAEWDGIVSDVRAIYGGKLTYSAIGNDDESPWQYASYASPAIVHAPAAGTGDVATQVSFWDKLDYVGLDQYSALSNLDDTALNGSQPTLAQLVTAWQTPFGDDGTGSPTDQTAEQTGGLSLIQYYESVAAATGKPLLFTEMGYNSAPDAAAQPPYTSSNAYDPALQAELYQAFFKAWEADGNTSLQGVWFWNWEPSPASVGAGMVPSWTPQYNATALADTKAAFSADESPACYLAGTRITTSVGECAVEQLRIGDLVRTAAGPCRPIRWIGRRSYAGRFLAAHPGVHPVRLRAGCLGRGLPRRDLLVSPDHAMVVDGWLVPARCLLNGSTVVREPGLPRVDYFHVELDSHDVLLAEGAPSESFIDDGSRLVFHNAAEYERLYPGPPARPLYCAPRLEQGVALEAIRRRMMAAAERIAA